MPIYRYGETAGFHEQFSAEDDAAAEQYARESLLSGDWSQASAEKSFRVSAVVGRVEAEPDGTLDVLDQRAIVVTLDPPEPPCAGSEHDWQSPYELVGGIAENPGVWGNGGGVIITEACVTCGAQRITDTWDTDPADGETFRSLAYQPSGHYDVTGDDDIHLEDE